MSFLTKTGVAALLLLGATTLGTVSASAAIVCKGRVCWHTHGSYDYPPSARIVVHEDNWRWGPREHFSFREHEGRGYWSGKRWTEF